MGRHSGYLLGNRHKRRPPAKERHVCRLLLGRLALADVRLGKRSSDSRENRLRDDRFECAVEPGDQQAARCRDPDCEGRQDAVGIENGPLQ